jgi:hypothetical protein
VFCEDISTCFSDSNFNNGNVVGARSRGAGASESNTFSNISLMLKSCAAYTSAWVVELAAPILACELDTSKSRKMLLSTC